MRLGDDSGERKGDRFLELRQIRVERGPQERGKDLPFSRLVRGAIEERKALPTEELLQILRKRTLALDAVFIQPCVGELFTSDEHGWVAKDVRPENGWSRVCPESLRLMKANMLPHERQIVSPMSGKAGFPRRTRQGSCGGADRLHVARLAQELRISAAVGDNKPR